MASDPWLPSRPVTSGRQAASASKVQAVPLQEAVRLQEQAWPLPVPVQLQEQLVQPLQGREAGSCLQPQVPAEAGVMEVSLSQQVQAAGPAEELKRQEEVRLQEQLEPPAEEPLLQLVKATVRQGPA